MGTGMGHHDGPMGEGVCVCVRPTIFPIIRLPSFFFFLRLILSLLRFRRIPTFHSSVCMQGIQGRYSIVASKRRGRNE